MTGVALFDVFMRAAFGVEPAAGAGLQLKTMAAAASLQSQESAPLDHNEGKVLYIGAGATKLVARASDDREQIIAFHFGGDIFSIPADDLHAFGVSALQPSELLIFPARAFFECAAEDPRIARAMLERQRTALHRCRDKTVALGQKNALERVAGFLVAMADRIGTGDGRQRVLDLPMSRRDIADSLGLTIETVSRQLGKLREDSLIETRGRSQVVIRDIGQIARRAGHFQKSDKSSEPGTAFDLDQCEPGHVRLAKSRTGGNS